MTNLDFEALFERLPQPFMVLDRAFNYVAVNAAYEAATLRNREDLIGRGLFEMFPADGEPRRLLQSSLERVFATGRPDTIALIHYAIPGANGQAEDRFWTATHTPLFDEGGAVVYVVQNTHDVTELQRLKAAAYGPSTDLAERLFSHAAEVQARNQTLLADLGRLRDLFMRSPGFIVVYEGPEHRFVLHNEAYAALVGRRDLIGKSLAEALPEVVRQGFVALLDAVRASGSPFEGRGVKVELQSPQGQPLTRYVDFVIQPVHADGATSALFVEGFDVTDRVRALEEQALLIHELNHRVKNTLATVQAIAAQTLRSSPEPKAFREAFEARLKNLADTHDLLTAAHWRGADLGDLVQRALAPYGAERLTSAGDPVQLDTREALALGLVFHELATNAAKHGALSEGSGRVAVEWAQTREPRPALQIRWREEGGPLVVRPTRQGFGSRLIRSTLGGLPEGTVQAEFLPEGFRCALAFQRSSATA